MVSRKCECGKTQASIGLIRGDPKWCSKCPNKPKNAINVVAKRCKCGKSIPSYGLEGEARKDAKWCLKCPDKPINAIDVINKRCKCEFKKQPIYGLPGKKAVWCAYCPTKPDNAIDVLHSKCKCGKALPTFGIIGEKPQWCASCPDKSSKAEDLISARCECKKSQPSFGLPGKKAVWCMKCPTKSVNAIDLKHTKCKCGSNSRPTFGYQYDKLPTWCGNCRPKNTISLISRICECGSSRPVFGLDGEKPLYAKWCAKCKPNNAKNIYATLCTCGRSEAIFGLPGEARKDAKWCSVCKPNEAVDVKNSLCESCGKVQPVFGLPDENKRRWCSRCPKPSTAIDLMNKQCTHCNITSRWQRTDYCMACYIYIHPDTEISRYIKYKENSVTDFIHERFPSYTWVFGKKVNGGSSFRQPDALTDIGTHVLIIENDEHQHKWYDPICVNRRTMELFIDCGNRPIVFIRFNPDEYKDDIGKNHPSCWCKPNKITRQPPRILSQQEQQWQTRLEVLATTIDKSIKNIPTKEITDIKLFYDDFEVSTLSQRLSDAKIGEKNPNYGKERADDVKEKISTSVSKSRRAKSGLTDEIIRKIRNDLNSGMKGTEVCIKYDIGRHIPTRIKSGVIVPSDEEKNQKEIDKNAPAAERIAITKRKVTPLQVLQVLQYKKNENPKASHKSIGDHFNMTESSIKRIFDNKTKLYPSEFPIDGVTYQEYIEYF